MDAKQAVEILEKVIADIEALDEQGNDLPVLTTIRSWEYEAGGGPGLSDTGGGWSEKNRFLGANLPIKARPGTYGGTARKKCIDIVIG